MPIWPSEADPSEWIGFLDESGDGNLHRTDPTWDVLCLAAVIIQRSNYAGLCSTVNDLKKAIFGTTDVILRTSDIKARSGKCSVLSNTAKNQELIRGLNHIFDNLDFHIIGAVVLKEHHRRQYSTYARPPYYYALQLILERLVHFLRRNGGRCNIVIESRDKKPDKRLQIAYSELYINGGDFVDSASLQTLLPGAISFRAKRDNDPGLQIADLAAYPLARRAYRWPDSYPSYEHIYRRVYDGGVGRPEAYGYKIFPSPPPNFQFDP